jgi:hypothetical protein
MRMLHASPFDARYWSTLPFLHGPSLAVRYSLVPASGYKSSLANAWAPHFLSENMRTHLEATDAVFDFKASRSDAGQRPIYNFSSS